MFWCIDLVQYPESTYLLNIFPLLPDCSDTLYKILHSQWTDLECFISFRGHATLYGQYTFFFSYSHFTSKQRIIWLKKTLNTTTTKLPQPSTSVPIFFLAGKDDHKAKRPLFPSRLINIFDAGSSHRSSWLGVERSLSLLIILRSN